jgi:cytochrome c biogenesis protein CcmG, thiol:disulfide interchange protein DsbE
MSDVAPAQRRSFLVLLPLIIFGAMVALFLSGLFGGSGNRLPSTMIGRAAPDVTLPALEGASIPGFGKSDLASGRVSLVNVFASWCAPCHAEHALLMDLAKDKRISLVGINQKDTPENARRFLGAKGNPYTAVGVDPNGRASIEWGVYGIPETFIVKGDGTIVHKLVGPLTDANLAGFKAEIEKALR